MQVSRIVAPYFGTNCWIVATEAKGECVIVDPGIAVPDLTKKIREKVSSLGLKPIAVMITHGHLDHTFSLLPLSKSSGIEVTYIHPSDRELLTHPERGLGVQGLALLKELAPDRNWQEPEGLVEIDDGEVVVAAGLSIEIIHAPGHTKGSVMYRINGDLLLSGDVLFKGSIGRTDLPTSSPRAMQESLKNKVLTLPNSVRVLPGHGEETTIAEEKIQNPFLIELAQ